MEKIRFEVGGIELVGDLYLPANASGPVPAVAIIGPMTYHKEQAPTEYARRLADQGFAALAYDSRYRGESGGEPRAWENPAHKVEDLEGAVAFLRSRPEIDPARVSILGICQGSSEAVVAASNIGGLKGLATVAGHYRDHAGDLEWLTEEGFQARISQGRASRDRYESTGEVDYIKGVDQTDMNVGMPGEFVWKWYQPWADRGIWENRYAVMSDASLLEYESISSLKELKVPWLMIHGDNCFLPSAARRHADAVPDDVRFELVWNDTPHTDYYDQAYAIDAALAKIVPWFGDA